MAIVVSLINMKGGAGKTPHPMLGFKNLAYAASTVAGVDLLHRIGKGQFSLGFAR